MKIFSLFLSGIALFHFFPFSPVTTFILFISLSVLLVKNTGTEKEASTENARSPSGGE